MSHPHRFSIRSSVNPSKLVFSASTNRKQPYGSNNRKEKQRKPKVISLFIEVVLFLVFLLSGCCPADRWRECDFALGAPSNLPQKGEASILLGFLNIPSTGKATGGRAMLGMGAWGGFLSQRQSLYLREGFSRFWLGVNLEVRSKR